MFLYDSSHTNANIVAHKSTASDGFNQAMIYRSVIPCIEEQIFNEMQ